MSIRFQEFGDEKLMCVFEGLLEGKRENKVPMPVKTAVLGYIGSDNAR